MMSKIRNTAMFETRLVLLLTTLMLCAYGQSKDAHSATAENSTPPNVLFLVADDLGFTDLGSFGSEIETPNIDKLVGEGIRFSRFYTAAMCAPTRAMLLSGVDNHRSGMGNMAELISENQRGKPGYEGYLNDQVLTLPQLLSDNGYHTYMVGKWHLGYEYDQSPKARGFDRTLTLLGGGASHFDDMGGNNTHNPKATYREDGELLKSLPKGFYSTRNYTDKLISHIDSNRADGKPFFAYAAYTAPHWPLHAPDDVRDKYAGMYDEGYDIIRTKRYQAIKEKGLIPEGVPYPKRPGFIPPWTSLTAEEKEYAAREMELYSAMVDDLDQNIGRLFAYLQEKGMLENTLIVFMSDNGADALSLKRGPKGIANFAATYDNSLENMGKKNSFNFVGAKWAHVSEAPFRLYKTMSTEGGIRVPAIIHTSGFTFSADSQTATQPPSLINDGLVSVMDLLPTVLEFTGVDYPDLPENSPIVAPKGRSLLPILTGQSSEVRDEDEVLGIELMGRRAVIKGQWKIIFLPEPIGPGRWELFNLKTDPGEQVDLAQSKPEKLNELLLEWDKYAKDNGVILPTTAGKLQINHIPSPTR